jgi:excisionase family DNA binding protein
MIEQFSKEYINFLEKNKLLPLDETAKYLNIHPATLRTLVKRNEIKSVKIGKRYYFNLEDIKNNNSKVVYPSGISVSNGYLKVLVGKDFPNADLDGYIALHKLILEASLLRRLLPTEEILHNDGNTMNNLLSNLLIKIVNS